MQEEVLARVEASAPRRAVGVVMLVGLGALLIYLGLSVPSASPVYPVLLIGLGGVALWTGDRMRRATAHAIELTRTELRCSDGRRIVRVDGIRAVERGTFAFKPSNGFVLHLDDKAPRAWAPGLWWRLGRRVGVGGVTAAHQTKAMAEILSAMVMSR